MLDYHYGKRNKLQIKSMGGQKLVSGTTIKENELGLKIIGRKYMIISTLIIKEVNYGNE